MSNELERGARALYESFHSEPYGVVNVCPWDEKRNPDRSRWLAHASAVIAATTPAPLTTAQVNTILYRYDHPQDHPGGHYGVAEATRDLNAAMTPTPDVDVLAEVRALRDSAVNADFAVTQLDPRENDTEIVLAIRVSDLNSILDREAGR